MRSKIAPIIGAKFENRYTIDESVYLSFMETFKDRNPIHSRKEFAISKGFPGLVMHGNILCGFLSHFIGEVFPFINVMIISQEITFHRPIFMNDEVLIAVEILDYRESVRVFRLYFHFKKDAEKLASGVIEIYILE